MSSVLKIDPQLDLVFERPTTLPIEKIWQGWTDSKTLMKWFCPRPWKVTDCRIDLRAGGEFFTAFEGPGGEKHMNNGCYLEVIEHKKLVWTGMMTAGFRPVPPDPMGFQFVATVMFEKSDKGTLYRAVVAHADESGRKQHEQMGFQEGWGMAFNQLVELF